MHIYTTMHISIQTQYHATACMSKPTTHDTDPEHSDYGLSDEETDDTAADTNETFTPYRRRLLSWEHMSKSPQRHGHRWA